MKVTLPTCTKILVVIDPQVEDYQSLAAGVISDATVLILKREQDGIQQISKALLNLSDVNRVHIISHGSPGCVYLGNSQLSLETIKNYRKDLQGWFVGVVEPELLLYGCKVATGDAGEEFVDKLQAITGANIAASSSLTGNVSQGGNWELDCRIGNLSPHLPFAGQSLETYSGKLGTETPGLLFILGDSSSDFLATIDPLTALIQGQLVSFASQDDFLNQMAVPFGTTAGSTEWEKNLSTDQKNKRR